MDPLRPFARIFLYPELKAVGEGEVGSYILASFRKLSLIFKGAPNGFQGKLTDPPK